MPHTEAKPGAENVVDVVRTGVKGIISHNNVCHSTDKVNNWHRGAVRRCEQSTIEERNRDFEPLHNLKDTNLNGKGYTAARFT
jgi:hypothetical protein